jgi:hypothetical protein
MGVTNDVPTGNDWEQVVSEATEHVRVRGSAVAAASEKQKPKSQAPKIAVLSVLLVAAIGVNVWQWTRRPAPMPAAEEATNMAWSIVDVAQAVEDFRADEGRLPSADDIAPLLNEDVTYQVVGTSYSVTVSGDSGSLTFDGSTDVEAWARNAWSANPTEVGS